jgi:hypothetical protein
MRLIDTATLRLVTKHDSDVPRYAILSHTWGSDSEEVSFQEWQEYVKCRDQQPLSAGEEDITKRPGYLKIASAAREARKHELDYLWVDTCCIDKTSSAELSEAINSMYRWYRDAASCYAFLGDVDWNPGEEQVVDQAAYDDLSLALQHSRWFTRGWTLQVCHAVLPRQYKCTDQTSFFALTGADRASRCLFL